MQPGCSVGRRAAHELEKAWDIVQLGDLARVDEDEEGLDDHAGHGLLLLGWAMACTISARLLRPRQRHDAAMAAGAQPLHQRVLVHALDRRLARGIDIGDDDRAGVVHAGAELLEQRGEAGVAVRLHHRDHVARAGLARRLQHRGDLHRMVAVVVDHRDAAGLAGPGEAALDALEAGERAADASSSSIVHLDADGDRGQRVLHVVLAEHRQAERLQLAAAPVARGRCTDDLEGGAHAVGASRFRPAHRPAARSRR